MLRRLPTRLSFHALRLAASPTAQREKERKRDRDKIRRKDRVQEGVIMYQRQQRKRKRKQHWSIRGGGAWCWRGRNQGAQWRDESNKTTFPVIIVRAFSPKLWNFKLCLHKSVISDPDRISRLMNYSIQTIGCFRSQMYHINHSGPVAGFFFGHILHVRPLTPLWLAHDVGSFRSGADPSPHFGASSWFILVPSFHRIWFHNLGDFFFRPQIFCMYTSYEKTPNAGLTFYLLSAQYVREWLGKKPYYSWDYLSVVQLSSYIWASKNGMYMGVQRS